MNPKDSSTPHPPTGDPKIKQPSLDRVRLLSQGNKPSKRRCGGNAVELCGLKISPGIDEPPAKAMRRSFSPKKCVRDVFVKLWLEAPCFFFIPFLGGVFDLGRLKKRGNF